MKHEDALPYQSSSVDGLTISVTAKKAQDCLAWAEQRMSGDINEKTERD